MVRVRSLGCRAFVFVVFFLWLGRASSITADSYRLVIDPANFTTTIDNPFSPSVPHTTYTYKGIVAEGQEIDTVEVTKYTKVIMGVTCVVVRDTAR